MNLETTGYVLLGIVAALWLLGMIVGMVAAFPFGLIGLVAFLGVGLLFIKVLKERLRNKEDDHYSRNVDK